MAPSSPDRSSPRLLRFLLSDGSWYAVIKESRDKWVSKEFRSLTFLPLPLLIEYKSRRPRHVSALSVLRTDKDTVERCNHKEWFWTGRWTHARRIVPAISIFTLSRPNELDRLTLAVIFDKRNTTSANYDKTSMKLLHPRSRRD